MSNSVLHNSTQQQVSDSKGERSFVSELSKSLLASRNSERRVRGKSHSISPKEFFEDWFRNRGWCYYFLFKKNLKVTNIQVAELISLMRAHFYAKGQDAPTELQFITSVDFKVSLVRMFEDFAAEDDDYKTNCGKFARVYGPLFRRLIVADVFFGSCAVFVPPLLHLDLGSICALSGYIHSCGYNVFTRKAYKATETDLTKALTKYFKRKPIDGRRVFFAAYTHEDFTQSDRNWRDELLDGLDNVKVFIEKYYMGKDSLVEVLRHLSADLKKSIVIPEAGEFRQKHSQLHSDPTIDHKRTLWLLVDHSTTDKWRQPGETKYFICYAQEYKNDNPFHRFDENKPAWFSHTTIPHTLMGAMINITRPWPRAQFKSIAVADPFVGSGTTWLEMLKYPDVRCDCSDKEPIVALLASDNLRYFSASAAELQEYIDALAFAAEPSAKDVQVSPESTNKGVEYLRFQEWALAAINKAPVGDKDSARLTRLAKQKGVCEKKRLFLYLALRTNVRHRRAIDRVAKGERSEAWNIAYHKEAKILLQEFDSFQVLRRHLEKAADRTIVGTEAMLSFPGKYSDACTMDPSRLTGNGSPALAHVLRMDARKLRLGTYDVIVTDPPYGFNEAGGSQQEMASFYAGIMETLVLALKPYGQLVFAVPDWSHTGKHLPYFTYRQVITNQILVAAEKHTREVFSSAIAVPGPASLFRPPYYWESERALRRAILHFKIRQL